jgi:hypothetical protein
MPKRSRQFVILVTVLLPFLAPIQAKALPLFAHRYGFTCQVCHTTVPRLNAFGWAFARNGFRLPNPRRDAVPIAVKVNLTYSSDADPTGLPKAAVDEVEVLTGGNAGPHMNYFIEQYALDGGRPGKTRDAWLQYNAGDRHIRAGQFTLPLPVDPESQRDTQAHYLLYEPLFAPRDGADAYFEDARGNALHLAAFSGGAMAFGAKTLGNFTLYAYRYRSSFLQQGFGVRATTGKLEVVGVDDTAGAFVETHYTFSPAIMAVARYETQQRVVSLVMRPLRNMRFTIEDQITDHHTLNLGWLFAY